MPEWKSLEEWEADHVPNKDDDARKALLRLILWISTRPCSKKDKLYRIAALCREGMAE